MLPTQAALILAVAGVIALVVGGYVALRDRGTYEARESDAYSALGLFVMALVLLAVALICATF